MAGRLIPSAGENNRRVRHNPRPGLAGLGFSLLQASHVRHTSVAGEQESQKNPGGSKSNASAAPGPGRRGGSCDIHHFGDINEMVRRWSIKTPHLEEETS